MRVRRSHVQRTSRVHLVTPFRFPCRQARPVGHPDARIIVFSAVFNRCLCSTSPGTRYHGSVKVIDSFTVYSYTISLILRAFVG
jgi:hypothetical protein